MSEYTDARKVGGEMLKTKALRVIKDLWEEVEAANPSDDRVKYILGVLHSRINFLTVEE